MTKSFGSNNPKNLIKAVMNGLEQLRSKELIESLRGRSVGETQVEEMIARGAAFVRQPEEADAESTDEASEAVEETTATDEAGN